MIQVDSLGHLLGLAHHTLVYAGCGLSTSAGVAQTARGHRFVEPRSAAQLMSDRSRILRSEKRTEAVPGLAHFALTSLYKVWLETGLAWQSHNYALCQEGLIDGVVCLNHDGLLQKAGCPQEAVHEVHGSWFDPANPALKAGGQPRQDIWQRCLALLDKADLCVVIGTSLSGLETDLIAETASRRCGLGLVIVNLQQTRLDGEAVIKISSEADTVMERLAIKLRLRFSVPKVGCQPRFGFSR